MAIPISLLKYLDLPWNVARGFLRQDLETLEDALNRQNANTTGDVVSTSGTTVPTAGSGGSGGVGSGTGSGSLSADSLATLAAAYVAARVSLKV